MMISTPKVYGFTFSRYQILLTVLFLAVNFTYFTMAPRILLIFGFPQPGGILIFPFTFLLADVITERYTYDYAKFLIWCVIITLGFFTLSTWLTLQVPAAFDPGYSPIFSNYPKLYLAITIATFFSFWINNTIVAKLKLRWHGRLFFLRAIFASSIGHAVFSVIWVFMYHAGNVNTFFLWKMVLCMYIWKICFELVGTPFANILSGYIKKKEQIDFYDKNTNYNPFSIMGFSRKVPNKLP